MSIFAVNFMTMVKCLDVVAGVIMHDNKVLCVKKGTTRYDYTSNKWEFPGGKTEHGETHEQALARELLEELNMNVRVGKHLVSVNHTYPDFNITLHAYVCCAESNSVTLKEHVAMQWVVPKDLTGLDWCEADIAIAQAASLLPSR